MPIGIVLPQTGYRTLRRWPRYKVEVPVRVIPEKPVKMALLHGRGSRLNGGGMSLFAGAELAVNEQLAIEFTPPGAQQCVAVRCFVRNRNGYIYGVEFITENDQDYKSVGYLEFVLGGIGSAAGTKAAATRPFPRLLS
jgi:hypothetical protein